MTREEKAKLISDLTEEFKTSDVIIVCNYKGLSVKKLEGLRIKAKEENVKVQVIKNTLADIALGKAEKSGLELKDTNIFIWGEDQIKVSKLVVDFAKTFDAFAVKTAFIEGEVATAAKVEALSKTPSRNELLAMLLQVWNAPITNFTIGLDALRAKKEQSA